MNTIEDHDENTYRILFYLGGYTLIDKKDWDKVKYITWGKINHTGWRARGRCPILKRKVYLHSLILDTINTHLVVDHTNHDTLDNRRSNIRACTQSDNCKNRTKRAGLTSKYMGVSWNKQRNKWHSIIYLASDKPLKLGFFDDEVTAAKRYDEKALELFKEFANLNFK